MKRTIFSGLLTSAGLSAAVITGSLNDGKGGAVTDATASLYNPDTTARQEAQVGASGKFSFGNLPAGAYILRVDKPGFAPVLEEFNVAQDAKVDRGFIIPRETSVATPDGHGTHIDADEEQAKLVNKVQPTYPTAAKAAGV